MIKIKGFRKVGSLILLVYYEGRGLENYLKGIEMVFKYYEKASNSIQEVSK